MDKRISGNNFTTQRAQSLVIYVFGVIAVIAAALAAYSLMKPNQPKPYATGIAPDEAPHAEMTLPVYITLDNFTVTPVVDNDQPESVLYVGLTLRLRDEASRQWLEAYLPEIRSRLILLFSQQKMSSLGSAEGKKQLLEHIVQILNRQKDKGQSPLVTDVYYNTFILR